MRLNEAQKVKPQTMRAWYWTHKMPSLFTHQHGPGMSVENIEVLRLLQHTQASYFTTVSIFAVSAQAIPGRRTRYNK